MLETQKLLATWISVPAVLFAQDAAPAPTAFPGIWMPLLIVGMLYYFMLVKPERENRAKRLELINNLKKNDRVITAGGIHGTVANVQSGSTDVVIRIDENTNTKIHVQRESILHVVTDDAKEPAKA